MTAIRCKRRGCGSLLTERMDKSTGRLAFGCEPCERNAAGMCRDCDGALAHPRRLRCEACRRSHKLATRSAWEKRRMKDPATYAEVNAYRRSWYRRPAVNEKERARQRKQRERRGPVKRDALDRVFGRVYMRTYRAKKQAESQRPSKVAIARRKDRQESVAA